MEDILTAANELTLFEPIDKNKVKSQIYEIRGMRVMLDKDIAAYFGVTTGNLNKAKNRNIDRFPENFCFTLTDQEISLFQNGIPMQTKGFKGGRSNNPTVYTEHGVAMLTSVLHSPRAVSASIQIINVFVEVAHYIRQNYPLIPYEEIKLLQNKQDKLAERINDIEESMVTKDELSDFIKLFDSSIENDEILILDGEPFKADLAYQKIYANAAQNIIVIDDYLGLKTLHHLAHAKKGVQITIVSDNKGSMPLKLTEFNDFSAEYPNTKIKFITSSGRVHDRYIAVDFGTENEKLYHCGASSKDAGRKITTITEIKGISDYHATLKSLLLNKELRLKP